MTTEIVRLRKLKAQIFYERMIIMKHLVTIILAAVLVAGTLSGCQQSLTAAPNNLTASKQSESDYAQHDPYADFDWWEDWIGIY